VSADKPGKRPPLADDPAFMERLSDLDDGLEPGPHGTTIPIVSSSPRRASVPVAPPASPVPARRVLPAVTAANADALQTIASVFDALIEAEPPAQEPQPRSVQEPPPQSAQEPPPQSVQEPLPPLEPVGRRRLLDLFPPESSQKVARHTSRTAPRLPAGGTSPPQPSRRVSSAGDAVAPPRAETYEWFYGLREAPFALSSDPRFLYHSTPHDRVAQQLLTAIRGREGLVVLTGDLGAGKTTVCRAIVDQLDRRTLTSLITDPTVSGEDLLKNVLADFGVMSRDELASGGLATRHDLSTALRSFVGSLASLQASAVVIIDEAQNLPSDVLEEVRVLSDIGDGAPLLQVVLVGQPSLTTLLKRAEYKAIHQRVAQRCHLEPLPADEVAGYVIHRLAVAGSSSRVEFAEAAIPRIFALTRGVPRVMNLVCDRALARGFEASASTIDVKLVDAAADDLDLGPPKSRVRAVAAALLAAVGLVLCILVGAGAAAWVFRDAVHRTIAQWEHVRKTD
jgi:type II secretory pathway predicted ATPase ExeA